MAGWEERRGAAYGELSGEQAVGREGDATLVCINTLYSSSQPAIMTNIFIFMLRAYQTDYFSVILYKHTDICSFIVWGFNEHNKKLTYLLIHSRTEIEGKWQTVLIRLQFLPINTKLSIDDIKHDSAEVLKDPKGELLLN